MRLLRPVLGVLLLATALPAGALAHDLEHRSTRTSVAGCPPDAGAQAKGCGVLTPGTAPDGTPDPPTVCAGTRRSPDPEGHWDARTVRMHVRAASGEGVGGGTAQFLISGPGGTSILYGSPDAHGVVDLAMPGLSPGHHSLLGTFFGSETWMMHGEPPHALKIVYDPSDFAGTLEVIDCNDFKVTLKATPTTTRTGMVFDRPQGRATFFTADGDCLSSCSDLTLVVRDGAGRRVEDARVVLRADAFPAEATASGKEARGRFCEARIPNPARCETTLVTRTDADGKVGPPLRLFPPALVEDAETTLVAHVTKGDDTAVQERRLPARAGTLIDERAVTLSEQDATVLFPSAYAYSRGPQAIEAEQVAKACDPVKPLLILPVFRPMKEICDGIGKVFNPRGVFDKLKLLEAAWFLQRFGIPPEGLVYQDFLVDDTTSDFLDAVHELLRNAFAVYGESYVEGSRIVLSLHEVSVPPGKLALELRATFTAPNGHRMSSVDTDVSKGYEASMFLGALAQGRGAPDLANGALRASSSGSTAMRLSCATASTCRGTVRIRARSSASRKAKASRSPSPTRTRVLGRASYRIPAGRTRTVRVRLGRSARRTLARRRSMRVDVEMRGRTAKGSTVLREHRTLRAPRRR